MFDSFKLCINANPLAVSAFIFLFPCSACCQLLKAWGAHITVTCSQNAEGLVRGLGADEVVDYTAGDVAEQLEIMEKYVKSSEKRVLSEVTRPSEPYSTLCVKC